VNLSEVVHSDDAQLALRTFLAVDPGSRHDWFETARRKTYPSDTGN
jgi:hypothetical protein